MKGFGMMVGACICSASFVASSANAVLPSAQAGGTAKVEAEAQFAPVPTRSSDTLMRERAGEASADVAQDTDQAAHLAQQYALHRASLYLYNPGRIAQMARAQGGAAVEQ